MKLGNPYHGFINDGKLILPNGSIINVGGPDVQGDTYYVNFDKEDPLSDEKEQLVNTQEGHVWKGDAVLFGKRKRYNPKTNFGFGAGSWPWIDPYGNIHWLYANIYYTNSNTEATLRIYHIANNEFIAQKTNSWPKGEFVQSTHWFLEHNKIGSEAAISALDSNKKPLFIWKCEPFINDGKVDVNITTMFDGDNCNYVNIEQKEGNFNLSGPYGSLSGNYVPGSTVTTTWYNVFINWDGSNPPNLPESGVVLTGSGSSESFSANFSLGSIGTRKKILGVVYNKKSNDKNVIYQKTIVNSSLDESSLSVGTDWSYKMTLGEWKVIIYDNKGVPWKLIQDVENVFTQGTLCQTAPNYKLETDLYAMHNETELKLSSYHEQYGSNNSNYLEKKLLYYDSAITRLTNNLWTHGSKIVSPSGFSDKPTGTSFSYNPRTEEITAGTPPLGYV